MGKIFLVLLASILLIAGCTQEANKPDNIMAKNVPETGTVYFGMADKAADMGNVASVKVTIGSVEIMDKNSNWINVLKEITEFDLLELKESGATELLGNIDLEQGIYGQVRLAISKVVVTDLEGGHEAILPSGTLKINTMLKVNKDSNSLVVFDFIADRSLHVTGNGTYILAPVIQVKTTENTEIMVNEGNKIEAKGGKATEDKEVGMDIEGNMGMGKGIPEDVEIDEDAQGRIKIREAMPPENVQEKGRVVVGITDAAANLDSITSIKINVTGIKLLAESGGWIVASSESQEFDLLQLRSSESTTVAADLEVDAGKYTQMELAIGSASVIDVNGEHEAKMPSGRMIFIADYTVNGGGTAVAVLDFMADRSVHLAGKDKYVLAPVIKVKTTEDANIEVDENKALKIKGGKEKTNEEVGMDENGAVGAGISISPDKELEIDETGKIKAKSPKIPEIANQEGRLVVGVTDAAISLENIKSIVLTVSEIKVKPEAGGWVIANTDIQSFDLLKLRDKNEAEVAADLNIPAGKYVQMQFTVDKAMITDNNAQSEAKMPSGRIKFMASFTVNEDGTALAILDFLADKSIHRAGNGKYIMAPVIKVRTYKDANVAVNDDGTLEVEDAGTPETDGEIGMDAEGNVGEGLSIPLDANLDVIVN